ncbi:MAG: hypothetical protein ABI140_06515 [Jatrophihabitantaceae bacterium]
MTTAPAQRALIGSMPAVRSRAELAAIGVDRFQVRAHCAARRWQLVGRAVVLHNGPLTRRQRWRAAQLNCGPRSQLTAFTSAEAHGLRGWERDAVHVLAPRGTPQPELAGISVRLHRRRDWAEPAVQVQALPAALLVASASFPSPRPACGILAAAVQQRLTTAQALAAAIGDEATLRHRAVLMAAIADVGQGSQALSEIDFFALCRRYRLPLPQRQTVRRDSSGKRRYLDATWRRSDGRLVAAEVDGAIHLAVRRWWDDQLRHNELSLGGALVLRFPSVVVRTEPELVAAQIRRALKCHQ